MAQDGFQDFEKYHLHQEIRTHWLEGNSGLLTCRIDGYEKTLFFEKGVIQWAKSNDPQDHLHGVLVKSGFLTQSQLDSVCKGLEPGQIEGKDLVDLGLITQQELHEGLRTLYYQIFSGCMVTGCGSYRFHSILPTIEIPRFPVAFPELFFKAILSMQDKPWLVSQFPPNLNFKWQKHSQELSLDYGILPAFFQDAVEGLSNVNDFRKLVFESGLDEFLLLKTLYGLQLLRFLRVDAPETENANPTPGNPNPTRRKPARRRHVLFNGEPASSRAPAQRRPTGSTPNQRQLIWLAIPLVLLAFFSILFMVTHTIARGSSPTVIPPEDPVTHNEDQPVSDQNLKDLPSVETKPQAIEQKPQEAQQMESQREAREISNLPSEEKPSTISHREPATKPLEKPSRPNRDFEPENQTPALYTIGIYLICQEETIHKTRKSLQSFEEVFLVPKTFDKRDCYWVCWGQFPSRWQALKTIPGLPNEFRAYKKQMTPFLIKDLKQ